MEHRELLRRSGARAAGGGLSSRLRSRRATRRPPAQCARLASSDFEVADRTLGHQPDRRLPLVSRIPQAASGPATGRLSWFHDQAQYLRLAARRSWLGIPAIPNVSGLGNAFIAWRAAPADVIRLLSRLAFRRARVVFFQNADDCRLFVERRIVRPDQARMLPGIGRRSDRFAPAEFRPERPPTFLLIGRLLRDKGVGEFVEAARSLRSELPNARFQMLGPIDEVNRTAISQSELDSLGRRGRRRISRRDRRRAPFHCGMRPRWSCPLTARGCRARCSRRRRWAAR